MTRPPETGRSLHGLRKVVKQYACRQIVWGALGVQFLMAGVSAMAATSARLEVHAHRGGAGLAPENTLAAFRKALELGVDALEMDLHVTRDGAVVVIHDETLDRTTDGRGGVSALRLEEVKR